MNETTKASIRDHAIQQYPRESCGLIVVVKGRERYLPCRNIAATPDENFTISPDDYLAAEELGEVIGVVHSHPDTPARPSQADLVMCEQTELPWHIVNVSRSQAGNLVAGDIFTFHPSGYVAPLVGREFSHGVLDCYSLIRDYYNRELGIELPNFERRDNWWLTGQRLYLEHFEACGFRRVKGQIKKHDVVLMQIRSPTPNHGAVYIGNSQILHHQAGRLSSRDVYSGYFQELTVMVVRHESSSDE